MQVSKTTRAKEQVRGGPLPDPTPKVDAPEIAYNYDKWYKDKEISDLADNLIYHIRRTADIDQHENLTDEQVAEVANKVIKSKLEFLSQ